MKKTKLSSLLLAVMLCMAALFCSLTCSAMASEADAPASAEQTAEIAKPADDKSGDSAEKKAAEDKPKEAADEKKDEEKDKAGKPLSEETEIYTRDLLYDEDTHKQFITVSTKEGDTFYIIIDYDKPSDEDGEQYEAYFLNAVDNADLTALLGEEEETPPVCTCSTRCAAGAVNMTCEVCAANMTECAGEEPEPKEPIEEPESNSGFGAAVVALLLLLAMAGGGTAYYLKTKKPKTDTSGSTDLDSYDFGDDDEDGEEYESIPEETEEPGEEPDEPDEDYPMEDSDEA